MATTALLRNPDEEIPVLPPDDPRYWEIWVRKFLPGTNQKGNAGRTIAEMLRRGALPTKGTFINFAAGTGENMLDIIENGHFNRVIAVEPTVALLPELERVCKKLLAVPIHATTLSARGKLMESMADLCLGSHFLYYVQSDARSLDAVLEKGVIKHNGHPEGRFANVAAMLEFLQPHGKLLIIQENPSCGAQRLIDHFFGPEFVHDLTYIWHELMKLGYRVSMIHDDSTWVGTDINDAVEVAEFFLNLVRPEDQALCSRKRPTRGEVAEHLEARKIGEFYPIGCGQDFVTVERAA